MQGFARLGNGIGRSRCGSGRVRHSRRCCRVRYRGRGRRSGSRCRCRHYGRGARGSGCDRRSRRRSALLKFFVKRLTGLGDGIGIGLGLRVSGRRRGFLQLLLECLACLDLSGGIVSADGNGGGTGSRAGYQQASRNLHTCLLRQKVWRCNTLMIRKRRSKQAIPPGPPRVVQHRAPQDCPYFGARHLDAVARVQHTAGSQQIDGLHSDQ